MSSYDTDDDNNNKNSNDDKSNDDKQLEDDFFDDDVDPLESEDDNNSNNENQLPFVKLSGDIIRDVTGTKDLSRLTRLEVLFGNINELGDLHLCSNLKEMWITQTSLFTMSNLSSLKYTLQSLCLADQKIAKLENLDELVNLRELFLYSNVIEKIENLNSCSKLQRLWLNSNRIEVIENIDHLVELKQLWLQDNKISKIPSLSLPKLEELALSGNRINDLKSISPLGNLPNLRILSFNDNLYTPCPIAKLDGYKTFIIFHLTQVQTLDMQPILQRDRDKVQELYEKSQRVLKENMNALRADTRSKMSQNESRRNNNGRGEMAKELQKKVEDRDRKLQQLDTILHDLRKKYTMEVNRLLQKEYSELEVEMKYYSAIKGVVEKGKESKGDSLVYSIQGSGTKYKELDEQDMEFKFVSSHFKLSTSKERTGYHFGMHEILKLDIPHSLDSKFSYSSNNCKRMYLPVSRGNIAQIIKSPLDGSLSSRGVQFYSTALQAHNQNIRSLSTGTCILLLCRVLMVSSLPQVFPSPKQRGTPLSFYETENTLLINNPELVLPEYLIKYGVVDKVPMPLEGKAQIDKYSILDNLEVQAESEFMKYKISLWDKLQPDVVDKIRKNESNLQKLKNEVLAMKRKIREEKCAQEEILRNCRIAYAQDGMPLFQIIEPPSLQVLQLGAIAFAPD